MQTNLQYQKYIDAGSAFLDMHKPGWFDSIDTRRLNLASVRNCVIAQLFDNSYYVGLDRLGLTSEVSVSPADLGFNMTHIGNHDLFNQMWSQHIDKLQAESRAGDVEVGDFILNVNGSDFPDLTWAQVTALVESMPSAELVISRNGS